MKNTKFWLALGVMASLIGVFFALLFTGNLTGHFEVWVIAFVAVPVQYGVFNVVSSGQTPPSPPTGQ